MVQLTQKTQQNSPQTGALLCSRWQSYYNVTIKCQSRDQKDVRAFSCLLKNYNKRRLLLIYNTNNNCQSLLKAHIQLSCTMVQEVHLHQQFSKQDYYFFFPGANIGSALGILRYLPELFKAAVSICCNQSQGSLSIFLAFATYHADTGFQQPPLYPLYP